MEQQEIIYFEINNWFCGRDYPPIEPFKTWVHTNRFSNDAWCKENKLVVMTGPIDIIMHTNKETGKREDIEEKHTKKFSDFLCFPDEGDEPGEIHGHIADDWWCPEYCEANFGVTWNNSWWDDMSSDDDDDEEDDEEETKEN